MRWMVHGGARPRQAARQDRRQSVGQPGTPQHELREGGAVGESWRGGGEVHEASGSASSVFFDFAPFTTSGLRSVMQAS